mmetsp:Transcript_49270/g.160162  ORF Transcript_49270/g.160162 Transcript_49270/m.160162 type:complete len:234 (+) Transcript_49270:289-990(+)
MTPSRRSPHTALLARRRTAAARPPWRPRRGRATRPPRPRRSRGEETPSARRPGEGHISTDTRTHTQTAHTHTHTHIHTSSVRRANGVWSLERHHVSSPVDRRRSAARLPVAQIQLGPISPTSRPHLAASPHISAKHAASALPPTPPSPHTPSGAPAAAHPLPAGGVRRGRLAGARLPALRPALQCEGGLVRERDRAQPVYGVAGRCVTCGREMMWHGCAFESLSRGTLETIYD